MRALGGARRLRGLREVDDRVLVLELLLVLPALLRQSGVAVLQLREHLFQQPDGSGLEVRDQRLFRVLGTDRNRLLGKDVARVEAGVHVVVGHADLGLAVADRPRPGMRSAPFREQRRMPVHDPESRHVDRLLRDEPRKACTKPDVGPVGAEQRPDRVLRGGEDHVGLACGQDEGLGLLAERPPDDHRRHLVPERRDDPAVPLDDRDDLGEKDDAHARRD